jgi:predicted porin
VPGFIPGNAFAVFPFADVGTNQTANQIVYLSPKFAGVQFGASFAPNTQNLWNDPGCSTAAGAEGLGCNRLSAQDVPILGTNYPRYRNRADIGLIYTETFGGFGINTSVMYMGSGVVANNSPGGVQYDGFSVGQAGLELSYAGFTIGGNVVGGQMNGDYNLMPRGGRQTLGWLAGAQYQTGPIVVGASYFQTQFAGNWLPGNGVANTENDIGVAAGGTYTVAPGMVLFLSYLYGQRHQIGYDFVTGTAGSPDSNNTHASVFALGTQLQW